MLQLLLDFLRNYIYLLKLPFLASLALNFSTFFCFAVLPAAQTDLAPLFTSDDLQRIPTAFKGRFRPLDSSARLWLYEMYGHEHIRHADRLAFHSADGSAQDLLWKMHFLGHMPWDNAPFFKIENNDLKKFLGLDVRANYFSYNQLHPIFNEENTPAGAEREREHLQAALSQYALMNGSSVSEEAVLELALARLKERGMLPKDIALQLEAQFPLASRLSKADSVLRVLPGRREGEWLPLRALKTKLYHPKTQKLEFVGNFTPYSNEDFEIVRSLYLALETAVFQYDRMLTGENKHVLISEVHALSQQLAMQLNTSYALLAGVPYKASIDKSIVYPSLSKLRAEVLYYQYPTIALTMIAYAFAGGIFLLFLGGYRGRLVCLTGFIMLLFAFSLHSIVLILRCYILARPPVSNMFETVIYVPWIAVLASFILYWKFKNVLILVASSLVATILFILLQVTNIGSGLENVQAVLDSQYWLIIHVLLIVGSYGIFALSGILAHLYLGCYVFHQRETAAMQFMSKCIVQSIYLGVAMLIPGTILGGVWAAESWGRFWDWDPKESWAFISICIYLIWIHAYTFHHVRNFGLAVGAVVGLMAISFTWYGVNYVLGTGLHSYGFGSGGEYYYYLFLLAECLFLVFVGCLSLKRAETIKISSCKGEKCL